MNRICILLLSILFGSFLAPQTHAGPRGIDDEEWYVVKMQDQQCGYMHAVTRQDGEQVRTKSVTQMNIARGAAKVKVIIDQEFKETLRGEPLAFMTSTTLGDVPIVYSGIVKGGKIHLSTEQFGQKKIAEYAFDPEVKFPYGQLLAQRQRGLAKGTSFRVKSYEPSLKPDGPIELEFRCHGKEPTDVLGRSMTLNRVTALMHMPTSSSSLGGAPAKGAGADAGPGMAIETDMWVDDDARLVITTVDIGVARVQVYASTKDEALKDADPPELFLNTFIEVDRKIGHGPTEVVYRFKLPADREMGLPTLPDTDMQTFKRISKYEGQLTVRRLDWGMIRAVKELPKPDERIAEYLRASSIVDINDTKIKRLAKRGVKGATTPAEKADALRKYVTNYIEHKGMDVGFATASEVARNRRGDCTEHGVLLAALARAAGLPARGVSGIVEVPEGYLSSASKGAFGYHMWTQVYIGGQWVDIDGALRQTDCDPTHIALALMPLNEGGMMDGLTSLLPLLGKLQIEIVSVK